MRKHDSSLRERGRVMAVSSNGWPVLTAEQCRLRRFAGRRFLLAPGAAGYVLAHYGRWFHRTLEQLNDYPHDDHGWGYRKIGGTDVWSNHSSGTAIDLNAIDHPDGRAGTFTPAQAARIRERIAGRYAGLLRWGGDYNDPDEMHVEINVGPDDPALTGLAAVLRT